MSIGKEFGAHPREMSVDDVGNDKKFVDSLPMPLDLQNERYHSLTLDYIKCVSLYLNDFHSA